jgi:hypothetical protein
MAAFGPDFTPDWNQLSKEDRQTVIDTRVSNKAKGARKASEVGSASRNLKDIKQQVAELKRSLAAIKTNHRDAGEATSPDAPDNAGDSFGGRQQKKQKKD